MGHSVITIFTDVVSRPKSSLCRPETSLCLTNEWMTIALTAAAEAVQWFQSSLTHELQATQPFLSSAGLYELQRIVNSGTFCWRPPEQDQTAQALKLSTQQAHTTVLQTLIRTAAKKRPRSRFFTNLQCNSVYTAILFVKLLLISGILLILQWHFASKKTFFQQFFYTNNERLNRSHWFYLLSHIWQAIWNLKTG